MAQRNEIGSTGAANAYRTMLAAAPTPPLAAETSGAEPVAWGRDRACRAAGAASNRFGQWVPQRWLDFFMEAYEADQ